MLKSEMLNDLIDYYAQGNKSQFARMLGVTPQVIIGWSVRNSMSKEIIYAKLKGVSAHWLLTDGEGEMIESAQQTQTRPTAPTNNEKEQQKRIENLRAYADELERRIENLLAQLREQKNAATA